MRKYERLIVVSIAFCFLSLLTSCIIQMGYRKENDGSTSLSKTDSLHLAKFDIQNFNNASLQSTDSARIFQEIDGDGIKLILKKNKFTWILLWATWCPHSYNDVPRALKYYENFLKGEKLNIVLVTQNYDMKAMNKMLSEFHYKKQCYVLSAGKYGTAEFEKVVRLKQEICTTCPEYKGVPQHILLDQDGKLIFFKAGELTKPDTILRLIK